jgi:diguanylate cyclase (GGDEF)-like protein
MDQEEMIPGCDTWYKVLFQSNPLPMLIYDRDTLAVLDVNDSAVRQYGYSAAEWQSIRVTDLHPPSSVARAIERLSAQPDESALLAAHFAGIWQHLKKDGTPIEVDIVRYLIPFHGKTAALVMLKDLTGQCPLHDSPHQVEQDLNQAQQIARLGSWIRNFVTGRDRWSDQTYRNFGVPPQTIVAGYDAFMQLVHPEDREMVKRTADQAVSDRKPFSCVHRVLWPDGSTHTMQEQAIVTYDNKGRPLQMIGTTLDVTEHHRIESELRRTQKDLQWAQQIAHIGTWTLDPATGTYDSWSDETYRVFGFKPGELPLNTAVLAQRIHPDDRDRVVQARNRAVDDPGVPYDIEFRILNPQLGERVVHSMGEVVRDSEQHPIRMVGFMQDITRQKCAEEQIKYLAYYDKGTDLPNRAMLEERLEKRLNAALHRSTNQPPSTALLIIHLTRFRDINYTLGHANGERLLKQVGGRIDDALRGEHFVARTGNAQFAVILHDADSSAAVHKALEVLGALQRPFPIAEISYELGANVGIALAPSHGTDAATIVRKADVALYLAKKSGQACVVYDAATDPYNPQRLAMIGEFRKSVLAGELKLYCQPKAAIPTGEIVGVEALVRWAHPTFGLVPPDQFVPLIEPTDLIHPLTRFMLEASIRQAHEWRRNGVELPLAVNLSPRNLMEPGLVSNLKHLLGTWGGEPDWLGLEITESSLIIEPQTSVAALDRLSKMGFRLFIDDFGTGYSSLSYLMSLPVNVIKIDHSFTLRMIEDRHAAAIVKSTIELAHNLGMRVVAEGTANRQIWDALAVLGCDEAQGYYISPPMPAEDFLPWLEKSGHPCYPPAPPPYSVRTLSAYS